MAVAPGSGSADGEFGRLRASHGDRDRAMDVLKAAYAEGRLTKDEYDERMAKVFASRTYAELGELTGDLPAGPFVPMLPAHHLPAHLPARGTNGMAIASLILGLAQPFTAGLTAIPAVICGHVARQQIRRTGESGLGLATAGLVFGWLGVAFMALIAAAIIALAVASPQSP